MQTHYLLQKWIIGVYSTSVAEYGQFLLAFLRILLSIEVKSITEAFFFIVE